MGLEQLPEHDLRYEMADEYLSLVYKYLSFPYQLFSALTDRIIQALGGLLGSRCCGS